MTSAPRVSVIIPTRNRAERIRAVLDALMADPYPDKEIIVCDGASSDGTVDVLRSYGDRVRWVSERDGGEFPARNKALGMATGEIIRNLSDDDVPVAGGIGQAVDHLAAHPDIDILFGQTINFYVTAAGRVVPNDSRKRTARSIELRNFMFGYALYPVSETVFMRRRVIDRIGLFDAVRGGDYEYWARAAHAGLRLALCDHIFVHHYRYETGERELAGVYRQLLRGAVMLADRYGSRWDRVYVRAVWLPSRQLKHDLGHLLPPWLALRIRQWLWRRRGEHVEARS